jgi:hypothetical protein
MTVRAARERGAILPLTALMAVGSFMMVALVVDGGELRVDRRTNKGMADVAARAGVARLAFGPWSGVCEARKYLLANAKGFSSFDAGTETWSNGAAQVYAASPCPQVVSAPDSVACAANQPSTWARFQATAGQGRFTIEMQSGYVLPDPRYPEDVGRGDLGNVCDNLAVIITERQSPAFAQVAGFGSSLVSVRSVGRLNATETLDFVAALQLLERHKCDVLQTGGANTRVIAQPFGVYPGTVQIDSAGDSGSCPSPILNGQATSGGPSVLACSTNSTNPDCRPGIGERPSRIGVYAANFNKPANIISTPYPSTYGDTKVIGSPRTSRKFTDQRYRANVDALDEDAKRVITGNSGRPPGCPVPILLNTCTANGVTWLVLQPVDCSTLPVFFAVPGRTSAQHIWFNCDLNVSSPLTLTAANANVVVTGQLRVSSTFTVTDPRKVYVGGQSTGPKVGMDLGSGGTLNLNVGSASRCRDRTEPGHSNRLVVGHGSVKVGSGASARMCQTFTYIASGYDKVPANDGNDPCSSPCSNYTGTISVSSGSFVDLSAPNEITGRLPDAAELATTHPFEDLALWTEAGGNTNGLAGGAATQLRGVFFMPNADAFNLSGGGALPIDLSAQFVSTSLKVTGGATVNLVPNPEDSIPVTIYTTLLVR